MNPLFNRIVQKHRFIQRPNKRHYVSCSEMGKRKVWPFLLPCFRTIFVGRNKNRQRIWKYYVQNVSYSIITTFLNCYDFYTGALFIELLLAHVSVPNISIVVIIWFTFSLPVWWDIFGRWHFVERTCWRWKNGGGKKINLLKLLTEPLNSRLFCRNVRELFRWQGCSSFIAYEFLMFWQFSPFKTLFFCLWKLPMIPRCYWRYNIAYP